MKAFLHSFLPWTNRAFGNRLYYKHLAQTLLQMSSGGVKVARCFKYQSSNPSSSKIFVEHCFLNCQTKTMLPLKKQLPKTCFRVFVSLTQDQF